MGGLLCKQRRGQSPESQGKKKRKKPRGECFLRAPCMLCFIVHNSQRPHPDSCPASPEPPAARLLLLCPGELNAWEERGRGLLCAGLLRGPALLCPVSSQQPPMACKRKNSGDCQQPRHPCKLPRSASAEEETCGPSSPGHLDNCTPPPEPQECCTQHGAPQDHHAPAMPTPHPEEEIEPFHLHQLPPSLLLKIFANLTLNERCLTASLVCKYWRDLCLDFQFWWQLDLSGRQQVKDDVLEKIASRYPNLTEINISDCLNVSDAGICKLAQNCPGLVKYTAYRCKQLSDTSLLSVASQCPCLQKVHVGNQDRLSDEVLKQLGTKCRELKDIHFGQCYKISDEGLIPIAKGSPKLQRIYMQENKLVSDESVKAFAEHCPELQYVGFMGCSVTSEGVIHLTKLKHLSSLDLRHITKLDNETVMEVVRRCHNLTSLNLCLNRSINDRKHTEMFSVIAEHYPDDLYSFRREEALVLYFLLRKLA
uniref:F-box domain-containing protein n=1 Tax=Leptobrachium leishanense TaxID=445787 RepID=A0A8C5LNH7_9ANUR